MLVIGLPVLMLFMLQWRSLERFELARKQTLEQATAFAAKELAEQIEREFKSPILNLLEQVDHADARDFTLDRLASQLDNQRHHFQFLTRFFVWSKSTGELLFYAFPASESSHSTRTSAGFFRDPEEAAQVLRRAGEHVKSRKLYGWSHYEIGEYRYDEILHFIYDVPDRAEAAAFIGFTVDWNTLRDRYFASRVASTDSEQNAGVPKLAISIFDDRGREVFRSGRSLEQGYEAEAKFAVVFFDPGVIELLHEGFEPHYWSVRTGFQSSISLIARSETHQQRLTWFITVLIAVGCIGFTVRATAHELRLAHAKSDFVSSVSHDFKSPLALIEMFADTLESGRARTPEKIREYCGIISKQSRKLNKMIGGIVDFAKIEAGVRDYPCEDIDLRGIIRGAIASCEDELTQNGFRIEMELPDRDVPIRGNAEGLLQLFCNLLDNAIKYSNRNRFVRVAIRFEKGGAVGEVTDHGIGIPAADLKQIFNKFYRVPQGPVTKVTGSGLGLAIVQHIAHAHRAQVRVASTPDCGSTFAVWFPLADGALNRPFRRRFAQRRPSPMSASGCEGPAITEVSH